MKEKQIVANNLKRFRQFKGLTQADLAKKVGLTKDTISKIELGIQENIGVKYLVSICRELDISMTELFMDNPNYIPLKINIDKKNAETIIKLLSQLIKK